MALSIGCVVWFARTLPVPEVEAFLQSKPEIRQVLLCGIEAHVCVSQTALDLLQSEMEVFVLADAVSSQRESDRAVALEVRLNFILDFGVDLAKPFFSPPSPLTTKENEESFVDSQSVITIHLSSKQRLRCEGATIQTCEMALFEMLGSASEPGFKVKRTC